MSASVSVRRGATIVVAAVLTGFIALVLGAFSSSASATPYPPSSGCTVATTTGNAGPGDSVTFVGSGFAPNENVSLSVPSASAPLGSVTTNGSGSFSGTFTWPASVNGASATVQASAPNTTCSFTLINHQGTAGTGGNRGTAAASGSSGLSSTGFQTLAATTIALALIGAGAMFLGLARRKRA